MLRTHTTPPQSPALLIPTLAEHSLFLVISFFRALKPTSLLFPALHNFPALPFLPTSFPTGQFNQYSSRTNANNLRIHHHLRGLVSRGLYKALFYFFTFTLLEYFIILFAAALFAASPASPACDDVYCICESANVSTTVKSQASVFHLDQGISVSTSGRLPSLRRSPTGSLLDGVCVRKIALCIMPWICACLCCHAVLLRQEMQCNPPGSTII